jgi:hypothetical protein
MAGDRAVKPPEHENCEAGWVCLGCDEVICPRCAPSPNEPELCADCWWIDDLSTPGLDGAA